MLLALGACFLIYLGIIRAHISGMLGEFNVISKAQYLTGLHIDNCYHYTAYDSVGCGLALEVPASLSILLDFLVCAGLGPQAFASLFTLLCHLLSKAFLDPTSLPSNTFSCFVFISLKEYMNRSVFLRPFECKFQEDTDFVLFFVASPASRTVSAVCLAFHQ